MPVSPTGTGPGSALRFDRGQGRGGQGSRGINYPSPFFDIAQTYLPNTVKQMFRWCRYYYLTNPLINAVVSKMSTYPITGLIYDTENRGLRKKWEDYLEGHHNIRPFIIEVHLDYHTYGNALVSVHIPFDKYLRCRSCTHEVAINRVRYQYRGFRFYHTCPGCGFRGEALVRDHYLKSARGIRLIRWNPEDVEIKYNDLNGEYTYFYEIPQVLRNEIIIGRKDTIEKVPHLFVEALREKRAVVLSKDNLFHMKRPSLAHTDRGWGTPMILPVLKDTYYMQILRKAQEAIALDHIVPLRIIFPATNSADASPYSLVNLQDWQEQITTEIQKWRLDHNYMPILPLPVGQQNIGGDGRALLLHQEMKIEAEHIVAGMGVPPELVFGGMSYSGSNVSLRMVENEFLRLREDDLRLIEFIQNKISNWLGWPKVGIRWRSFKMADDLQRKAYLLQLSQLGKVSDTSLLEENDMDIRDENRLLSREAEQRVEAMKKQRVAMAEIEGEASLVSSKYQGKAQVAMQTAMAAASAEQGIQAGGLEQQGQQGQQDQQGQQALPSAPGAEQAPEAQAAQPPGYSQSQLTGQSVDNPGASIMYVAQAIAQQISAMPQDQQQMALASLQQSNPTLAEEVIKLVSSQQGQGDSSNSAGKPLPEQRPPRRGPESALI